MSSDRPQEFDDQFVDAVRRAIRRAYELARDFYDPEIGVDGQIFSFAIYKIAARQLESELAEVPGARLVAGTHGREVVRGERRLRWNKVGMSERVDISASFPNRSYAAALMAVANSQQLELGLTTGDPTGWVIAHAGNPAEGLCALYLAAPIEARNGRVTGWLTWLPIFDRDQPDEGFPALPAPGPIEPLPTDLGALDVDLLDIEQFETGNEDASK